MGADDGVTEIVKSPVAAACTVSVAETEWLVEPLVPVIVSGYDAPAVSELVSTVIVEVPDVEMGLGLKVAGAPVAPSVTEPENPFTALIDTV